MIQLSVLQTFADLFSNFKNIEIGQIAMLAIGAVLIYLAIKKEMEPSLLLPLGFGTILVNLPMSGAIGEDGPITVLFSAGISTGELFPLLLFIGIGAMIDFGPLLKNPWLMLFGAAAQFGIFFTFFLASFFFDIKDAASIAVIGAADGPTSIYVAQVLDSAYLGPIMVAAYSYMALVPIIQPPFMRLLTTKKERLIRMKPPRAVSKTEKIIFPIVGLLLTAFLVPSGLPLLGMLFFGNLLKESGVTKRLADAAKGPIIDIVTTLLGLTVGASTQATEFLTGKSVMIFGLGAFSFIVATCAGVLFVKIMNIFLKPGNKVNPLIGNSGVSAVPDSARISQIVGLKYDPTNYLLMHAMGPNVAGVIGSAVAAGVLLGFLG